MEATQNKVGGFHRGGIFSGGTNFSEGGMRRAVCVNCSDLFKTYVFPGNNLKPSFLTCFLE